jgi:hypothetical protein
MWARAYCSTADMNRLLTLRYLCGIYETVTYPMSHIPEISPVDLAC